MKKLIKNKNRFNSVEAYVGLCRCMTGAPCTCGACVPCTCMGSIPQQNGSISLQTTGVHSRQLDTDLAVQNNLQI
jgi:hypothetical protein